ncbi:MAG: VCBS repeat-containing protein [Bryobacterales bacterium]|nr:VCBS repeat-containing protein [Bryobacterales bacterium]
MCRVGLCIVPVVVGLAAAAVAYPSVQDPKAIEFGGADSVAPILTPQPNTIQAADINGDKRVDLLVSVTGGGLLLLKGQGDGRFEPAVVVDSGDPKIVFTSATAADIDGDGRIDLLTCAGDRKARIAIGNRDGTFRLALSPTDQSCIATFADFNGDKVPDMAWVKDLITLSVAMGKGDGSFAPAVSYRVSDRYAIQSNVGVGDFNGDLRLDLAVNRSDGVLTVLWGNGDGTFGKPATAAAGRSTTDARFTVADFDGDGNADVALAADNSAVRVLFSNGDGTFRKVDLHNGRPETIEYVAAADLNGDGFADLAYVSGRRLEILAGARTSAFIRQSGAPMTQVCAGGSDLAVADINGDSQPDLVNIRQAGDFGAVCASLNEGIRLDSVLNGAGQAAAAMTFGQLISLQGKHLGPEKAATQVAEAGKPISTSLNGVEVLMDNVPIPVLTVQADRIDAMAPYSVRGRCRQLVVAQEPVCPDSTIRVTYGGRVSNSIPMKVETAAPVILTVDPARSQAAATNTDGSGNRPTTPAPPDSVVTILLTGAGEIVTVSEDIYAGEDIVVTPKITPSVELAGQPAEVVQASLATGMPSAVIALSFRIPSTAPTGELPLKVWFGDHASQEAVSIAVGAGPLDTLPESSGPTSSLLQVEPLGIDFGPVDIGSVGQHRLSLTAAGTKPIVIRALDVSAGYSLSAPLDLPITIEPSKSRSFEIHSKPTTPGLLPGAVTITVDEDPGSRLFRVPLVALGVKARPPAIRLSTDLLDFGRVGLVASLEKVLRVRNVGVGQLSVMSVKSSNAAFTVSPAGPFSVAPEAEVAVTVRFSPGGIGAADGMLELRSTDPESPEVTVALAGFGENVGAPALTRVIPNSLTASGSSAVLTLVGLNFSPASTVLWNGARRPTVFTSSTQVRATLPAEDLAKPGLATVAVLTPTLAQSQSLTVHVRPADDPLSITIGQTELTSCTGLSVYANIVGPDAQAVDNIPVRDLSCTLDGKPLPCSITTNRVGLAPLSVVLVVAGGDASQNRAAGYTLSGALSSDDRAALIYAGREHVSVFGLGDPLSNLTNAITGMTDSSPTGVIYDTAAYAGGLLVNNKEAGRRKAIVVVTSATDTSRSHRDPYGSISYLEGSGVPIFAAVVGPAADNANIAAWARLLGTDTGAVSVVNASADVTAFMRTVFNTLGRQFNTFAVLTGVFPGLHTFGITWNGTKPVSAYRTINICQ